MEKVYVISLLICCICTVHGANTEFTLLRGEQRATILSNYSISIRPSEMTTVNVTMAIRDLIKLDIGSQTLSTTFYLHLSWFDERLVWTSWTNYSDYFLFKISEIWTPDVVLDNFIEDNGLVGIHSDGSFPLRVSQNGTVVWIPRISTTTTCQVNIVYYPYDTQTCYINITEWAYSSSEVNLVPAKTEYYPDTVYIGSYIEDGEWDLISAEVNERHIPGGFGLLYKNLQYSFVFKRRPIWYVPFLMIPLGLMSLLMPGVFLVPEESGEKMTYSLTVMLSFTVTLSFIKATLPSVSNTFSVIGVYIAVVMVTSGLVVILTAVVLKLHHNTKKDQKLFAKRMDKFCLILFSCFYVIMMIAFAACFATQLDPKAAVSVATVVPFFVIGFIASAIWRCWVACDDAVNYPM